MNFEIANIAQNIRVIDSERNYWFVRTYSGALFDDFLDGSFVGVGFNSIPTGLLKKVSSNVTGDFDALKTALQNAYELKKGSVTRAANQLLDFYKNVKVGDMVIMPSESSSEFAFGLIDGNMYQSESKRTFRFRDKDEPYPEKRRKIKWLKTLDKEELNGDFRNLIMSRSAITNANPYKDVIEGHLSSIYIREDKLYLTIQIGQEEDINAFAFNNFLSGLTYFYAEFCKERGEDYNEDLFLKIKVQSKGMVALKCLSVGAGIALMGLLVLADNSKAKLELFDWVKVEGESGGFLSSITKFKDASQERRHREILFQDSLKRLQASTVKDPINKSEDTLASDTSKLVAMPDSLKELGHIEAEISKPKSLGEKNQKQISGGRKKDDRDDKSDNK